MIKPNKIKPFLWFEREAEEAAQFYTLVFPNSGIGRIARYPEGGPGPAGSVLTVEFTLEGQTFVALNGGPQFRFSEAVSFQVDCADQAEVDYYWERLLSDGGTPGQCGWLKDRYGLSWQVVPRALTEIFTGGDAATAGRVMQAMLPMQKLDVAKLHF